MVPLADKVVIVTGGGRGIGRAIALGAAAAGAKIVIADYGAPMHGGTPNAEIAELVVKEVKELGGEAVAVCESVATMAGARGIVDVALATWGRVDGLVCCAGIVRHRPFLELTEHDFDAVIETHVKGHFTMYQATLAAMAHQGSGGSLIGMASGYVQGDSSRAPYRTAKAAVVGLTQSVALAAAEYGVRANLLSPIANTRLSQAANLKFDSEPEDIAPMAIYLLSDRSKEISGELFSVSGKTVSIWQDPFEKRSARNHARWNQADLDEMMPWLRQEARPKSAMPPLPASAMPRDGL